MTPINKVFAQIGYTKNLSGGHKINIWHNNELLQLDGTGDYISALMDRKKKFWYLKTLECLDNDIITVEVKVGIRGLGPDEDKSCVALFEVDSNISSETTWDYHKLGYGSGFSILKGPIKLVNIVTEKEQRLQEIKRKMV